jgi:hypothetical protein
MLLPASAAARVGVGIGFYGPVWGGYWGPYGYPYGYAPYGYGYPAYGGRPLGEVQIKSPDPKAQIFVNGSYAGQAHDLKRIYLAPGTYNLEQHIGSDVQKQRVYVLVNRSVKIEFGKPGTPSPRPAPPPPPDMAPSQPPRPAPDVDAPR